MGFQMSNTQAHKHTQTPYWACNVKEQEDGALLHVFSLLLKRTRLCS